MHFKKLEIAGFKSFLDRTVIQFEPGVTAIVGPNGCGKSNVSDAIRWVLGEQSAKSLRGSAMEDVIFNGTSDRPPVNLAEVTLTLSNEARILPVDYEEVSITRRLYRSGESEYLINNNTMRLKDIHEMLLGTGIGTDHYSVIEQGKMDRILAAKPEERREIFEEAAGITKYKAKKREALRKLEQTEQNLLRVGDIIQEVKRQIGTVERQARKAEAYRTEFEKLKKIELAVSAHDHAALEERRGAKQTQLDEIRVREEAYGASVETLEESCRSKREQIDALEEAVREHRRREIELSASLRACQDRIGLDRERIGELGARREQLSSELLALAQRLEELARQKVSLASESEAVLAEETQARSFLDQVESSFAAIEAFISDSLSREEEIRRQLLNFADRRAHVQTELAGLRAQIGTLDHRVGRLEGEKITADAEAAAVRAQEAAERERHDQAERLLAELRGRREEAQERQAQLESAALRSQAQIAEWTATEAALRAQLEFLEDLKARHEGFAAPVKSLVEESSLSSGFVGLLADLVHVEGGYELAAEAALGPWLQAAVYRTGADLRAAAAYLRSHRKGRAALVSLEHARRIGEERPVADARSARSFVRASGDVEGLLGRFLETVYLAASSEEAYERSLAHPGTAWVTRDGERYEAGTAIGGADAPDAATASVLGREDRIRRTRERLQETAEGIEEIRRRSQEERAQLEGLEESRRSDDARLEEAQQALGDCRGRLGVVEHRLRLVEERHDVIRAEREELERESAQIRERERQLLTGAADVDEGERSLGSTLTEVQVALKEKSKTREDFLVKLAETRSRQEHHSAKRQKIEDALRWTDESAASERARADACEREISEIAQRRAALEAEIASLEDQSNTGAAERDEALRRVEASERERDAIALELEDLERERDGQQQFLRTARDQMHGLELELSEIRHETDRLRERVFNAYQADFAAEDPSAYAALLSPDALDEAREEIARQKEKLQKMGPVNLVAIEEHEEMKARYDFLTQQHQDLVQAKEDLHEAIRKINRTTRELFTETFARIQQSFTEYYKKLFGGGTAELILLDEQDVLESGIEIVARPPGKKLQGIQLLSGGEKALTSTALLFALFKVKPSPFCVLDEIDAPLDETNVDRFCQVLKEFTSQSQFIVITHNKRTMNLADALYGVTMAETGVSRIVSVRFPKQARDNAAVVEAA